MNVKTGCRTAVRPSTPQVQLPYPCWSTKDPKALTPKILMILPPMILPIFPRSSERTGKEEEKWQNQGWQNHKKGGTLRPLVTFAAIPILIVLPVYLSASCPFTYLSRIQSFC